MGKRAFSRTTARAPRDEGGEGPAIKPVTRNIVNAGKTYDSYFCRILSRVCVHYAEAWNNAVPFMAKEEKRLNHPPPAPILQVYSNEKVYYTRRYYIGGGSIRFLSGLSPPRGRGAINSLFRLLEPSRSKIR